MINQLKTLVIVIFSFPAVLFAQKTITNPIIPGYFADSTIIQENGIFYIYDTIDPWGAGRAHKMISGIGDGECLCKFMVQLFVVWLVR